MELISTHIWQSMIITIVSSLVLFATIRLSNKKPELGGILSSFPTSITLVIIFAVIFVGKSSAMSIASNLAYTIVLFNIWMIIYFVCSKRFNNIQSVLFSLIILGLTAYIYNSIQMTKIISWLIYLLIWLIGSFVIFKNLKIATKKITLRKNEIKIIVTAAIYIALVITIAKFSTPLVAAILSAFPTSALFGAYYNQSISKENLRKFLSAMYISTPTISLFCLTIVKTVFYRLL